MGDLKMLVILGSETWRPWLERFLACDDGRTDFIWGSDVALDIAEVVRRNPGTVVFMSHQETQFRDRARADALRAQGYRGTIVCSPEHVVSLAFDKPGMASLCRDIADAKHIPDFTLREAEEKIVDQTILGVVYKLKDGTEGKSMRYLSSVDDLRSLRGAETSGEAMLQPFVEGEELSLNAVCDGPRQIFYPIVSKGMTSIHGPHPSKRRRTAPAELPAQVERAIHRFSNKYLSSLDFRGIAEIEFIRSGDDLYFLEINPRLSATMRLSTVVTRRNLFADFLAVAGRESCEYGVVEAERVGMEWTLPRCDPGLLEEILANDDHVWASSSRITVAADDRQHLSRKVQDIKERFAAAPPAGPLAR